ncbi:hypothetical protein HK098_008358 [Nowakowskiella sp. JEL0407]|nr:hypothetical protein HK098_008358 [Nowakowskiella sp. JEL0407]
MRWFEKEKVSEKHVESNQKHVSSTSNTTNNSKSGGYKKIFWWTSTSSTPVMQNPSSISNLEVRKAESRSLSVLSSTAPLKSAMIKPAPAESIEEDLKAHTLKAARKGVAFDVSNVPIINIEIPDESMNKNNFEEVSHVGSWRKKSVDSSNVMRGVFSDIKPLDRRSSSVSSCPVSPTSTNTTSQSRGGSMTSLSASKYSQLGSSSSIIRGMKLAIPGEEDELTILHRIEFEGLPVSKVLENGNVVVLRSLATQDFDPNNLLGTVSLFGGEDTDHEDKDAGDLELTVEFGMEGTTMFKKLDVFKILDLDTSVSENSSGEEISETGKTRKILSDKQDPTKWNHALARYYFVVQLEETLLHDIYLMLKDTGMSLTKSFSLRASVIMRMRFGGRLDGDVDSQQTTMFRLWFSVSKIFTPSKLLKPAKSDERDRRASYTGAEGINLLSKPDSEIERRASFSGC